jgi:hypothetical protein
MGSYADEDDFLDRRRHFFIALLDSKAQPSVNTTNLKRFQSRSERFVRDSLVS